MAKLEKAEDIICLALLATESAEKYKVAKTRVKP